MKGDMGGAATVAATMYGISKLKLPVNVVAVTPLAENLPSGRATKPGDVVRAMNGKSIEVINTDAEGRLILVSLQKENSRIYVIYTCFFPPNDLRLDYFALCESCKFYAFTRLFSISHCLLYIQKYIREIGK